MQPLDKFNSNLGTAIALVGSAGAGKTALALRLFPKTYVFVADLNFESGRRYLTKLGLTSNIVGFDNAFVDENNVPVPTAKRYDRMFACITAAEKSSEVDTIVLDSGTFIEDIFKAKISNAASDAAIRLEGFKQWGDLILIWKSFIMQLRQSGKKIVFVFHEKKEKDESDQVFKYRIAVDGQISDKIPALFSDVWRCEIEEKLGTHTWMVRTLSNQRQEHLKNTYGLPGLVKADEVVKLVREATK